MVLRIIYVISFLFFIFWYIFFWVIKKFKKKEERLDLVEALASTDNIQLRLKLRVNKNKIK